MKSFAILSFSAVIILMASCVKPKEPQARICPDDPVVIRFGDTLELENCSENFETQRWELPDNAFSTQRKVAIASNTPLSFLVKLAVRNADYARDYIAERKVKIISKYFSTSTVNSTLTSLNSDITVCTVVDDIDATDPDGYYTSEGPPTGYKLVENVGNGCYKYALVDPANPPIGPAVTYHYFCIDVEGGFCDTTKVVINTP